MIDTEKTGELVGFWNYVRSDEYRRNAEAQRERERHDAAWERELEQRADGKPFWLWFREYEV